MLIQIRITAHEPPDLRIVISRADMRQPGVAIISIAGCCGVHVGVRAATRAAHAVAEAVKVERADDGL